MDVARQHKPSRKKYYALGGGGLALGLLSFGLARLKPAVPVVERQNLLVDTLNLPSRKGGDSHGLRRRISVSTPA